MVDPGLGLEASRAERVRSMSAVDPTEWSAADLAFIREGTTASRSGIPLKRLYGSDFAFRDADEQLGLQLSDVGIKASMAHGGFSNVWGAAVLPFPDADTAGWPFGAARLADHYRAVARLIGIAAAEDDLASRFPIFAEPRSLALSGQATRLLARLERHRETLARAGLLFGKSRLAVAGNAAGRECAHCGLCMYGCPYGLIYNSASTVDALRRNPRFRYRPGVVVDSVRETAGGIAVLARDLETGEQLTIDAERAYLAAGVIPSAQIVLRSVGAYDRPVTIMDSQYFLVPLLTAAPARELRSERLHTLSQLFLELYDAGVSPFGVHLQLYTYNDLMGQGIRASFGPLARAFEPVARSLERRMLVIQGYLHSSHSGTIRAELTRTASGDALVVNGVPRDETKRVVGRVLKKLVAHTRELGALPLTPLAKIAEPGRGFHTGGSFPMRERPAALETDVLGRPAGWQRLHVVDSSILPSIPAATITFAVMANAHRIASESVSA